MCCETGDKNTLGGPGEEPELYLRVVKEGTGFAIQSYP
jgi:hypothetical protein